MDIGSLKKNSAAIEAGQWVSDIPNFGSVRLCVRGLSSATVSALRARKERAAPITDRERDGSLSSSAALRVTCEVLLEAVLLDWDGLTSDGKPLPYGRDIAHKLLTDPDLEAFADAVVWAARVVDRGRGEVQEAMAKNSARPSPGA